MLGSVRPWTLPVPRCSQFSSSDYLSIFFAQNGGGGGFCLFNNARGPYLRISAKAILAVYRLIPARKFRRKRKLLLRRSCAKFVNTKFTQND